MDPITIHLIAAARPNFMKIAPLYHALKKESWTTVTVVHTGQHYDLNMSDAFFQDLGLPDPDIHLGIGSGTHAEQTGKVMIAYEKVLMEQRPDMVIVVGDVNSTMAATLAAAKVQYTVSSNQQPASSTKYQESRIHGQRPLVAHLEAGLRSYDRTMPEEINRLVTDVIADVLWTPSPDADENLMREGVSRGKIRRVGNIMIDSLELMRRQVEAEAVYEEYNLKPGGYGVVTLHRPSNVDGVEVLTRLCKSLVRISQRLPLVFPVHPRTRKNLENFKLMDSLQQDKHILLLEPQRYVRFMNLVFNCNLVITDSGGIQEETTYLGIPCLTMRPNTERPITIIHGTNELCSLTDLESKVEDILNGATAEKAVPEMWDGHTSARVVRSIKDLFSATSGKVTPVSPPNLSPICDQIGSI
jgi:UDP-N-acetylglucosamine 2-epimerase (non-hydrolysing)